MSNKNLYGFFGFGKKSVWLYGSSGIRAFAFRVSEKPDYLAREAGETVGRRRAYKARRPVLPRLAKEAVRRSLSLETEIRHVDGTRIPENFYKIFENV